MAAWLVTVRVEGNLTDDQAERLVSDSLDVALDASDRYDADTRTEIDSVRSADDGPTETGGFVVGDRSWS